MKQLVAKIVGSYDVYQSYSGKFHIARLVDHRLDGVPRIANYTTNWAYDSHKQAADALRAGAVRTASDYYPEGAL
jgi:hypothetical protein